MQNSDEAIPFASAYPHNPLQGREKPANYQYQRVILDIFPKFSDFWVDVEFQKVTVNRNCEEYYNKNSQP